MADTVSTLLVGLELDDKNFSKNIKTIDKELKGLGKEFRSGSDGVKNYEKSYSGINQKIGDISKAFELNKTKLEQLTQQQNKSKSDIEVYTQKLNDKKAKLEEVTKQYNALTDEERENSEVGKALAKEMETLGREIAKTETDIAKTEKSFDKTGQAIQRTEKDMQYLTDELGRAKNELKSFPIEKLGQDMQNFGNKMQTVGDSMKTVGKNFTQYVTTGIVTGGALMVKSANGIEDAFRTIRVGTGATGKDLDALKGNFRNVFGSMPDDAGKVSSALADINTRTGQTGKPLEDLTKQFLNLSRITGEDVNQAIEEVTRAFGDWGIESKDQSRTLDFLFKTSQATGIGVTELAKQATDMGTRFRNSGFEMEDALTILGSWEKSGVSMERSMSGTNQALNNLAKEGCKDVKQGFQDLIKDIGSLENEQDAYNKTLKYFGSEAGPDVFDSIRSGKYDVEGLTKALKENGETVNGVANETKTLKEKLLEMKNQLQLALEPLGDSLKQIFDRALPMIKDFVDWVGKMAQAFTELDPKVQEGILAFAGFMAIIGPILMFFGTLISSVGGAISTIGGFISSISGASAAGGASAGVMGTLGSAFAGITAPVLGVVAAIVAVIAILVKLWKENERFRNAVTSCWNAIKDLAVTVFSGLGKLISSTFKFILDAWNKYGQPLKDGFKAVFDFIGNVLSTNVEIITLGIKTLTDILKAIFSGDFEAIKDILANAFLGMVNIFATFAVEFNKNVTDYINAIVAWFKQGFTLIYNNTLGKLLELVTGAKVSAKQLYDGIVNFIKNLPVTIKTLFTTAKDFAIYKLTELKTQATTKASEILNGIVSYIQSVPNRMLQHFNNAKTQALNKLTELVNALPNWGRNVLSGIANALSGIVDKFTKPFRDAISAVQKLLDGWKPKLPKINFPDIKMPTLKTSVEAEPIPDIANQNTRGLNLPAFDFASLITRGGYFSPVSYNSKQNETDILNTIKSLLGEDMGTTKNINQTVNIHSPQPLDARQIAIATKKTTRQALFLT